MTTTEIFPEDKIDPTAGAKEEQYPVERTLGAMGHIRTIAKKRKWQYLSLTGENVTRQDITEAGGEVSFIRKFFSQPDTAAVTHKDGVWAVWSGDGEPTIEAFPEYMPVDQGPGSEFLKGLQARLGVEQRAAEYAKAQTPGEPTKEGAVAFAGGTGLNDHSVRDFDAESEATARNAAIKRAESDAAYAAASKMGQDAWAFSSLDITNHDAMRARYKTRADAPIEMHPTGGVAAIWLGDGEPTRPAFPDVQPVGNRLHSERKNGTHDAGTHIGTPPAFPTPPILIPVDQLPKPAMKAKVSPHAPSAPLNEMGIKFYDLSKETVYSPEFRAWLQRVSDTLHAEAARIELSKMREKRDARGTG
jgi:hypothetical protein